MNQDQIAASSSEIYLKKNNKRNCMFANYRVLLEHSHDNTISWVNISCYYFQYIFLQSLCKGLRPYIIVPLFVQIQSDAKGLWHSLNK